MTALQLLSREDSLRAECGCSIERKGQPDPETGAVAGMGRLKACALHGAAEKLLEALRRLADFKPDTADAEADREATYADAKVCEECQRKRRLKWPPSGLCNEHYCRVSRADDLIKDIEAHQHHSMKLLAEAAIASAQPAPTVTVQEARVPDVAEGARS